MVDIWRYFTQVRCKKMKILVKNFWRQIEKPKLFLVNLPNLFERISLYNRIFLVFMQLTGFLYILKSIVLILIDDTSISTKLAVTKLPFRVEYGHKIDQYFYLILVHNYLTVFSHVTATVATDTLYFTLIQHACGMFLVVG